MQTILRLIAVLFLTIASSDLLALGLGNASVDSYIGQPLEVRVQLISSSQEELNTVTAGLASAATLEALGITRTVSMPLRFEVQADLDNPYIQITSRLPVSDPVIQVVVEASWSGGRLVREYTFFLDPPTFPSRAPAPVIINRAAAPAAEQAPEIYPLPEKANVVQQAQPIPAAEPVTPSREPEPDQPPVASEVSAANTLPEVVEETPSLPPEPRQTATVPADPVFGELPQTDPAQPAVEAVVTDAAESDSSRIPAPAEPAAVEVSPDSAPARSEPAVPVVSTPASAPQDEAVSADLEPSAESLGPVESGQTLWGIATDYVRRTPYSVNQAMLAIQRLNPDAFGNNNINLLKRGVILRMPSQSEMGRLSMRQAMVESMRQEAAFKAGKSGLPFDSQPPLFANDPVEPVEPADLQSYGSSELTEQPEQNAEPEDQLLQLVPPSQDEQAAEGGNGSALQPTGVAASEDLQEVLARTEEELANARQENAYLAERLRELESRVREAGGQIEVTDGGLAELEGRLQEERLSSEPEASTVAAEPGRQEPWYSGKTWWLIGLLLLAVAAVFWFLKRLGGSTDGPGAQRDNDRTTVETIRSEAEDILKSLEDRGESGKSEPAEPEPEPVTELYPRPKTVPAETDEAVELDGDDPETMLDLARAYISMADPEAARKILEEVVEVGNESQVAEARGMMEEL